MYKWSNWENIKIAKSNKGPFNEYGIYQISVADKSNSPIPINRLIGTDPLGILYIGRSGFRRSPNKRTIANRIREFLNKKHSGYDSYVIAKTALDKIAQYSDHHLQVRIFPINVDDEIESSESRIIYEYVEIYGELPPCNSSIPKA